ncbi:restriction endonuclease subunit S [Campylobacter hyointestinalis]|uniref:restriction endonuclease subunit S n=1 Tax=Campylobacter hyointestinalis TaxID=198 RepID=UPI0015E1DBD8|nr:restriction endonuclease subunit S [Campylobacter hyointestinalis]
MKCIEDEIPFEAPEGWAWARLGSIFSTLTGSTPATKDKSLYGEEYPFYKPADLNGGFMITDSIDHVSEKGYLSGRIVVPDTVLVTCIGATIGKTGIIRNAGICNQQINAILPRSEINTEYVYFLMCSKYEQNQIYVNASATTLPLLNKSQFDKLLVPIPPIMAQVAIVKVIINLLNYVDLLEEDKIKLTSSIGSVKSKILDLAIRGKLVPQDPNDEPASVLLERIRAEKEELIKQGKIKRDKNESVIYKGDDNSYYKDLPDNWSVSSLSEITTNSILNDGDWILSNNMDPSGEIKLIQLGSVGFLEYVNKGFKYLTPKIFNDLGCTEIHSGYMLINRIVSDKMCACILPRIEGKKITTVDTCWIAPKDNWYILKYILYAISSPSFQSFVMLNSSGTTRKRISKSNLVNLPLVFPPLAEQKRIVKAIEVAFTQLDKIITTIS